MLITIKFMCVLHTKLSKINPYKQGGARPVRQHWIPHRSLKYFLRMPNINIFCHVYTKDNQLRNVFIFNIIFKI